MEDYAGLDVSLELTSVCIVDVQGGNVCEAKVASEPEALIGFLEARELAIARVGLEAGPLSQWLHAGLLAAGFDKVLLETRVSLEVQGSVRPCRDTLEPTPSKPVRSLRTYGLVARGLGHSRNCHSVSWDTWPHCRRRLGLPPQRKRLGERLPRRRGAPRGDERLMAGMGGRPPRASDE